MKTLPKLAFLSLIAVALSVVRVAGAVESPAPSSESGEVTENLKTRLKETINAVDVKNDSPLVGFIGKVKDIVKNTMVVEDKSGKRNIVIGSGTNIVRSPGNTDIKLESVRIGDAVIAIGSSMAGNETEGKRIIVSDTPFNPPAKISGLGRISAITGKNVTVVNPADSKSITLTTGVKTTVKTPQKPMELGDLAVGDLVIYSALMDDKDPAKLTTSVIMKIKSEGPDLSTQGVAASPLASGSASPSASPKGSTRVNIKPSPTPTASVALY